MITIPIPIMLSSQIRTQLTHKGGCTQYISSGFGVIFAVIPITLTSQHLYLDVLAVPSHVIITLVELLLLLISSPPTLTWLLHHIIHTDSPPI